MDSTSNAILGIALMVVMGGMGLSLTIADFKRVVTYPKAILFGLFNQLIMLPIIGFLLVMAFSIAPEIAIGVMILAACPGGPTSNLISHLAKGDTALSVSLTAISSVITVFTIPIIINLAMVSFVNQSEQIHLDVWDTIVKIFSIVLIPVMLGMLVNRFWPKFAQKMGRPVKIISGLLLLLIIIGIIIKEIDTLPGYFAQAGVITLLLNILTMSFGYFGARFMRLNMSQSISITIESGIQNGTLAIAIAAGLLGNLSYAIAPVVYSIIMFLTAGVVIYMGNRMITGKEDLVVAPVKQSPK